LQGIQGIEGIVISLPLKQIGVSALFDDGALAHDIGVVGVFHRRKPVRNDYGGAVVTEPFHGVANQFLAFVVQRRSGFVKDQDRRIFQEHPGDGDALALAAGPVAPSH
jgi:hypothetical protein